MTQTVEELHQRLQSIRDLGEIVGAMRALAAMRNQQAQSRLAGTRAYAENLHRALACALDLMPSGDDRALSLPDQPRTLLAFCAEYGFSGGFTRRIVETAAASPHDLLWVVGRRGVLLCEEEKLPVDWSAPMAAQAGAIVDKVQRIAEELHRRYSAKKIGRLDVIYARRDGLGFTIERRSLLPIASPDVGDRQAYPPLLNEAPERLIAPLVEEYLFAEIVHAASESFFSENTARLMTMDSARRNIDEKLESLGTEERRVRQDETTTELFDVMTGVAAAAKR